VPSAPRTPSGLARGLYRQTSESDTRLAVSASRVDGHLGSLDQRHQQNGRVEDVCAFILGERLQPW
jgi:hypothetical protein